MAKPVKRQTHCFAPGCSTGYVLARKAGIKRSVFTVPNDEDRLKAWQRYVPRGDKLLDRTAVLCELHFEQRFIVRDYTRIVNGEVVKIPRGRPCLTDNAIPSIFPNTPSYLSKKLPQKRSSRTSRGEVLGKKRKVNDENGLPSMEHDSSLDVTTNGERVSGASCTVEKLEHMKASAYATSVGAAPTGSLGRLLLLWFVWLFNTDANSGDDINPVLCAQTLAQQRGLASSPHPCGDVILTLGHDCNVAWRASRSSLGGDSGCTWVFILLEATMCLPEVPKTQVIELGCLVVGAGLGHAATLQEESWKWSLAGLLD
ncbi:hypothetical protein HPB51_004633 [Rhipicephalus microplus]|uniref:THAP-type domain-containing protein n=1 Tax=Rhipicephalus microplus TaxID=6941 RepID=A0A9J6DZM3_RHIMP|nr:hypothetical protein HPB51_004633 [Rhipicephalus microplus]